MLRLRSGQACVLGAGIQGCCTALALSQAGWSVTIIDRLGRPMAATSSFAEGKIHLGYVYANEPDRSTADLMVDGALSFGHLIDSWLPQPVDWASLRSDPFIYGVVDGSLRSAAELEDHYTYVDHLIAERVDRSAQYLGSTRLPATRRVDVRRTAGFGDDVIAAYATSEVAVDAGRLGQAVVGALHRGGIDVCAGHEVREIVRCEAGFRVLGEDPNGAPFALDADVVVNCLWDGRLAIDETLGIRPARPWSYRLRYALGGRASGTEAPPSATLVLGPFGDVVHWPNGRVYLSWYPTGTAQWCGNTSVPDDWRTAIGTEVADPERTGLIDSARAGLSRLLPSVGRVRIENVRAGIVVAWGDSDIDDPDSGLHSRSAIGVHDHDGYLSIDTGKFTTAPLWAHQAAQLLGRAGVGR